MKLSLKTIPYFVIVALLAIIVIQRECGRKPCPPGNTSDTVFMKQDSVLVEIPANIPTPDTIRDSIPVFIYPDTAAILSDYYKIRHYTVPLREDSIAILSLHAKVYMNSLIDAKLSGTIYQKHTVDYKYITVAENMRNKIYAGFQLGMMMPYKLITAPTITLVTKNDHLYSAGYDPLNKAAMVGMSWKIRVRKKPP